MYPKFAERFAELINHNVPRTFIKNHDADGDSSDIPIEQTTLRSRELPKPPTDGFIATFCSEDK